MTTEPFYTDDPFGDNDDSWKHPQTPFEKRIVAVTGRKYFKTQAQAKRVRAIEANKVKYPQEYLDKMFDWCEQRNKQRTVILLDALISAIRNPDNLSKYRSALPPKEDDRSGYSKINRKKP